MHGRASRRIQTGREREIDTKKALAKQSSETRGVLEANDKLVLARARARSRSRSRSRSRARAHTRVRVMNV